MPTIHTDLDARPILKRRHADAVRCSRLYAAEGNRSDATAMLGRAAGLRQLYARELRRWRENDMVLIDGATYTQSGGNTALAARRVL